MKVSQLLPILTTILATLNKVSIEFATRIAALEGLILETAGDGEVPPEVVAELEALKAVAQQLDALNPDVSAAIETAQASETSADSGDGTASASGEGGLSVDASAEQPG